MSNLTLTVVHTLDSTVLEILKRLISPAFKNSQFTTPAVEPSAPKQAEATVVITGIEQESIPFTDVHKALLALKNKKGAGGVREVLTAFGVKTAPDIPESSYQAVMDMVDEKMGA